MRYTNPRLLYFTCRQIIYVSPLYRATHCKHATEILYVRLSVRHIRTKLFFGTKTDGPRRTDTSRSKNAFKKRL